MGFAHTPVAAATAQNTSYDPSRRRIWWTLTAWCTLWAFLHLQQFGYSWHYFSLGGYLLTHTTLPGGGLHLYASHPELQIGPLALLAAAPLQALGPSLGRVAATVLSTALGPVVLARAANLRTLRQGSVPRPLLLLTGILVLPVWTEVATHYTHLDDVLALLFGIAAMSARTRQRPVMMAILLAAAVDSKPWALPFGVLLMMVPRPARRSAIWIFLAGIAVIWLPFVLADPATLSIGHFTITNVSDSALRAMGVSTPGTPAWDRPAQLLLGAGVGAVVIKRGQWVAVPLGVIAARLLLDPATYPYYSTGLVVCAAAIDLYCPGRRLPVWTAGAFAFYAFDQVAAGQLAPRTSGLIRAFYCITVLALLVLPRNRFFDLGGTAGSMPREVPHDRAKRVQPAQRPPRTPRPPTPARSTSPHQQATRTA